MSPKQRLSATVDADLVATGQELVATGRAESLSAWVNDALRRQVDRDRRLAAMDAFLAAFEDGNGEITDAEIASAGRDARARAVVVRGRRA
jgi:Arc/MetJ-type ribon-helix-helix transcriptional regulator